MSAESRTPKRPEFRTSRDELFARLILNVPSDYVETENAHGKGRKYHITVENFLDAFWAFCDDKETAPLWPPEWWWHEAHGLHDETHHRAHRPLDLCVPLNTAQPPA